MKSCNYHDNITHVSRKNSNNIPQIQTENKTTNESLSKSPSGKTNINKKEIEKDTVNQKSTENIKKMKIRKKRFKMHKKKETTGKQEQQKRLQY